MLYIYKCQLVTNKSANANYKIRLNNKHYFCSKSTAKGNVEQEIAQHKISQK